MLRRSSACKGDNDTRYISTPVFSLAKRVADLLLNGRVPRHFVDRASLPSRFEKAESEFQVEHSTSSGGVESVLKAHCKLS